MHGWDLVTTATHAGPVGEEVRLQYGMSVILEDPKTRWRSSEFILRKADRPQGGISDEPVSELHKVPSRACSASVARGAGGAALTGQTFGAHGDGLMVCAGCVPSTRAGKRVPGAEQGHDRHTDAGPVGRQRGHRRFGLLDHCGHRCV